MIKNTSWHLIKFKVGFQPMDTAGCIWALMYQIKESILKVYFRKRVAEDIKNWLKEKLIAPFFDYSLV